MRIGNAPRLVGSGIYLAEDVECGPEVTIGHASIIGYPGCTPDSQGQRSPVRIGPRCRIGCFCVIESGVTLGPDVVVDHFVRIGPDAAIGEGSRLLYGARVHANVQIGRRCRVSGNCPDRTVLEDDVTHFGRLHHDYRRPDLGWDDVEEPSPVIRTRTVIGGGAVIVGGVEIGRQCYVAAGEIVRSRVPDKSIVYRGAVRDGKDWHGRLKDAGFFE